MLSCRLIVEHHSNSLDTVIEMGLNVFLKYHKNGLLNCPWNEHVNIIEMGFKTVIEISM